MKKLPIKSAVIFLFTTAAAFTLYEDITVQTGLPTNTIQTYIISDLAGDFDNNIQDVVPVAEDTFRIPVTRLLPAIITGDKTGIAKDVCGYIRLYCNSQKFADDYDMRRISALPLSDNNISAATLKHSISVHQTNIKNYPNSKDYVADEQNLLTADQQKLDALLLQANRSFPLKAEWEKAYPADPAVLIKRRLQEYLALAETVDFSAQLTTPDKYNKRRFVNPVYEKKNQKWKAIYRAGKDVNDVVIAFVKDWLKGDIISKEKLELPDESKAKTTSSTNTESAASTSSSNTTTEEKETPKDKKSSLLKKLKDKAKDAVDRQL